MNRLFLLFLSLSLSGTLVAFILFLLNPLLKNRISKTWQYYLFLIVILRLLLPFRFDINLIGSVFDQAGIYIAAEDHIFQSESSRHSSGLSEKEKPDAASAVKSASPVNNLPALLLKLCWLVWLLPAALLLLRKIISYCRYNYRIKNGSRKISDETVMNRYSKVCKSMAIKHRPKIMQNDFVATPMLVGFWQPVIVLPDHVIGHCDLDYILQHELTHYKRWDIGYKWLVQTAVCLHWFNPVSCLIRREIDRYCELSCDESVIRPLNKKGRKEYGSALLQIIAVNQKHPPAAMPIMMGEDAKLVKERLGAIMKFKKKPKKIILLSALLTAVLIFAAVFTGGYTWSKAPAPTETTYQRPSESNQNITIEQAEIRWYEGDGAHPYIHDIRVNNTDQTVTGHKLGMLAYDQNGSPLEIDWWSLDTGYAPSYYYLYSEEHGNQLPGQRYDESGGFSLNFMGTDPEAEKIAYVLLCFQEITFEDESVWTNPAYDQWVTSYQGKTVAVDTLKNYYPYVQPVFEL